MIYNKYIVFPSLDVVSPSFEGKLFPGFALSSLLGDVFSRCVWFWAWLFCLLKNVENSFMVVKNNNHILLPYLVELLHIYNDLHLLDFWAKTLMILYYVHHKKLTSCQVSKSWSSIRGMWRHKACLDASISQRYLGIWFFMPHLRLFIIS